MELHLGNPTGLTRAELIHSLPDKEFRNLTRSTVPSLCYWAAAETRIQETLSQLNFAYSPDSQLCFEYTVPSFGHNRPSFTDVMYLSDPVTIAFEAKHTEPRYETVAKWLGETPTENRRQVLDHWLSLIQPFAEEKLTVDRVTNVVYQMLHRAASACAAQHTSNSQAVMIYQLFPTHDGAHVHYVEDLKTLHAALKPTDKLKLSFQSVTLTLTEFYYELQEALKTADDAKDGTDGSTSDPRRHVISF